MRRFMRALFAPLLRQFTALRADVALVEQRAEFLRTSLEVRGRQFDTLEIQNDQLLTMVTQLRLQLEEKYRQFDTLEIQNDQALSMLTEVAKGGDQQTRLLSDGMEATKEGLMLASEELRRLRQEALTLTVEELRGLREEVLPRAVEQLAGDADARLKELVARIDQLVVEPRLWQSWVDRMLEEDPDAELLSRGQAAFLTLAQSHLGPSSRAGLWFNPPVALRYLQDGVEVAHINERILEVPFVFQSLSAVPRGARVLDVGAWQSTVALSLACLGYQVTALDLNGYPFEHPNLDVVAEPLEDWEGPDERYEAVVCLSSIEHFGLGAYGEEAGDGRLDIESLRRLRTLTVDGGLLCFTAPFGAYHVDGFQRTYDRAALDELLAGWDVEQLEVAVQRDDTRWDVRGGEEAAAEVERSGERAVVMVVARAQ